MIIFILSFGYNYGYAINLVQTMYAANSKIVNGKDNNKNDFPCAFVLFLLLFFLLSLRLQSHLEAVVSTFNCTNSKKTFFLLLVVLVQLKILKVNKTASKWLQRRRDSKKKIKIKQKHKVSHFYCYFCQNWNLGRILFIFIHSLINSKSNELPQSLGCLWCIFSCLRYLGLARAKSEAPVSVYSLLKQNKKLYNAKRRRQQKQPKTSIGLISKTTTTTPLHVQHTFLYTSLKLFCTTTTRNFQKLSSYTFYGGNVECVPVRYFFATTHFHLGGRQHFSFSHHRYKISM